MRIAVCGEFPSLMFVLRHILICLMVVATVSGGLPHVGCRCANGNLFLSCPYAGRGTSTAGGIPSCCSQSKAGAAACCSGSSPRKCCCKGHHKRSQPSEPTQLAAGHCTAFVYYVDAGNVSKPVRTTVVLEFTPVVLLEPYAPPPVRIVASVGEGLPPPRPCDVILLNHRWLI